MTYNRKFGNGLLFFPGLPLPPLFFYRELQVYISPFSCHLSTAHTRAHISSYERQSHHYHTHPSLALTLSLTLSLSFSRPLPHLSLSISLSLSLALPLIPSPISPLSPLTLSLCRSLSISPLSHSFHIYPCVSPSLPLSIPPCIQFNPHRVNGNLLHFRTLTQKLRQPGIDKHNEPSRAGDSLTNMTT